MDDIKQTEELFKVLFFYEQQKELEKRCVKQAIPEETMKLFLCKKCTDIVKCIIDKERTCKCGSSSGMYTDSLNAVFKGEFCVPIGISNSSIVKALQMIQIENKHQKTPTSCQGIDFKAFIMLDCTTSIKVVKKTEENKTKN